MLHLHSKSSILFWDAKMKSYKFPTYGLLYLNVQYPYGTEGVLHTSTMNYYIYFSLLNCKIL